METENINTRDIDRGRDRPIRQVARAVRANELKVESALDSIIGGANVNLFQVVLLFSSLWWGVGGILGLFMPSYATWFINQITSLLHLTTAGLVIKSDTSYMLFRFLSSLAIGASAMGFRAAFRNDYEAGLNFVLFNFVSAGGLFISDFLGHGTTSKLLGPVALYMVLEAVVLLWAMPNQLQKLMRRFSAGHLD